MLIMIKHNRAAKGVNLNVYEEDQQTENSASWMQEHVVFAMSYLDTLTYSIVK